MGAGVGDRKENCKGLVLCGSLKRSGGHTLEFKMGINVTGGLMKHVISDSDRS